MSQPGQYLNTSQQALLRVLTALGKRPLGPIALTDLVYELDANRDQVFRALKNLELAGWAEQMPGGGWRLMPLVAQLSERVRMAIADVHRLYLEDRHV